MPRIRIQSVEALPGYRLRVGLSDGRTVERAFPELATPIGSMDAPLQDPAYFAQVRLDPDLETAVWPNGYDICPDLLIWGVDADGNLLAPPEHAEAQG
jgi:hypothetical protein